MATALIKTFINLPLVFMKSFLSLFDHSVSVIASMVEGKGEDKFSGIRALKRSFHIFQTERDICATQLNYWTY